MIESFLFTVLLLFLLLLLFLFFLIYNTCRSWSRDCETCTVDKHSRSVPVIDIEKFKCQACSDHSAANYIMNIKQPSYLRLMAEMDTFYRNKSSSISDCPPLVSSNNYSNELSHRSDKDSCERLRMKLIENTRDVSVEAGTSKKNESILRPNSSAARFNNTKFTLSNRALSRGISSPYHKSNTVFSVTSDKRAQLASSFSRLIGSTDNNNYCRSSDNGKKVNPEDFLSDAAKQILAKIEGISHISENAEKIHYPSLNPNACRGKIRSRKFKNSGGSSKLFERIQSPGNNTTLKIKAENTETRVEPTTPKETVKELTDKKESEKQLDSLQEECKQVKEELTAIKNENENLKANVSELVQQIEKLNAEKKEIADKHRSPIFSEKQKHELQIIQDRMKNVIQRAFKQSKNLKP